MEKEFICPKCKCKGQWKPYKVFGKGCEYCKPKCRYCKKVMTEMTMEHYPKCKVFLKEINKKK